MGVVWVTGVDGSKWQNKKFESFVIKELLGITIME